MQMLENPFDRELPIASRKLQTQGRSKRI